MIEKDPYHMPGQHACPNADCKNGLIPTMNGGTQPCFVCDGLGVVFSDYFTDDELNNSLIEDDDEEE